MHRCIMALTRGTTSHYPCPICLVPKAELSKPEVPHELRTQETMQAVLNEALAAPTKADGEKILKAFGLRKVKVGQIFFILFFRFLLAKTIERMHSGRFLILTHMQHFHGIACMHIILGYSLNIYGLRFWICSRKWERPHQSKLMTSVFISLFLQLVLKV